MYASSISETNYISNKRNGKGTAAACEIIKTIGRESSVHGLAKIASSKNKLRTVCWTCFVIVGFLTASAHLTLMIRKYLQYHVVEVSDVRYGMPVPFPSVTVCNVAAFSMRRAKAQVTHKNSDAYRYYKFIRLLKYEQRLRSIAGFHDNMPNEARRIAYDQDDFILRCTFNKKPCSGNFTDHFDGANYFSCFTFNGGSSEKNSGRLAQGTGPQYGLSLILALDNREASRNQYSAMYNIKSNTQNSAGARVTVHEPNTIPFPLDQGFDVPPGYTASVSLKASLHSRLPEPHGSCTGQELRSGYRYKHTLFSCLQVCKQEIMIKTCGCKASSLPKIRKADNLKWCGAIQGWKELLAAAEKNGNKLNISHDNLVKDLRCEENLLHKLSNDRTYEESCDCHQHCSDIRYPKSISMSYWPLDFYQFHLLEILQLHKSNDTFFHEISDVYHFMLQYYNETDDVKMSRKVRNQQLRASKLIRKNLLRLNIYMEDLSLVEFKQESAYGIADLAADVGGSLGLWMGISVLSCVELVELIIRLCGLLCNRERQADQMTQTDGRMLYL